jgi:hypothetical protein
MPGQFTKPASIPTLPLVVTVVLPNIVVVPFSNAGGLD